MNDPRVPLVEVGADPALASIEARILVATVAAYNMVSRFLVALRIEN